MSGFANKPNEPCSGSDIDIWGDDRPTRPSIVPRPGEPQGCTLADPVAGCPPGCLECLRFSGEIGDKE